MPTPYSIPALQQTIFLADQPFATGGEGALHRVVAPAVWTQSVVKLLHPLKRTQVRADKAQYLIQHPPIKTLGDATLVWLQQLVYDETSKFAGYLMPYVEGDQLELLTTATLPKRLASAWKGWERPTPEAQPKRLMMGYHLAAALYALHQTQCYILADLKPDNVLVQPNGSLALVDTDSLAVVEAGQSLFGASVATPEYTPPEYLSKSIAQALDETWDRFSLAVILYRLLLGVHPFAASAKAPYDQLVSLGDKIEAGLFVQAPAVLVQFAVIPPLHQRFNDLDPALQTLFVQAFQAGHTAPSARPTAKMWATALADSYLTYSVHTSPSSQLPTITKSIDEWYHCAVQRLVESHRATQTSVALGELPSMIVWRRVQSHYTVVGQWLNAIFVKQWGYWGG